MDSDQSKFDFDAPSNHSGYLRWQEEMDAQKKAIEHRWGIVLGRSVKLTLKGYDKAIDGIIRLEDTTRQDLLLRINNLRFTPAEIETVTRV